MRLPNASAAGNLLLVEDNALDVELTLYAFREARLRAEVHVSRTGDDAIRYLLGQGPYGDRGAFPLPDLVLLDLKLPGIDGHEVLRRIKTAPNLKRLPVIILTSSQEESDLVKSYDSGANSYLVKPSSATGFLEVVHRIGQYWLDLNIGPPLFATADR
ncbi:MAG: response regulator [Chloroflexi bacterium]|nr:response regulator [Chloroflexota bacterium]